jgi:hypothetical protein
MPLRYFALSDDVSFPSRWHLATPTDSQGHEVDDWQFSDGRPLQLQGRLKVPVEHAGRPLDFSEAGIKVPVLHIRAATAFLALAPDDVQVIPVEIEAHGRDGGEIHGGVVARATRDVASSRKRLASGEKSSPGVLAIIPGVPRIARCVDRGRAAV